MCCPAPSVAGGDGLHAGQGKLLIQFGQQVELRALRVAVDVIGATLPGVPTLRSLNLCTETVDGIRNHSWSRPAPMTPEGEVVSWADRIAYVCHDFEDAVASGVVAEDMLPSLVRMDTVPKTLNHSLFHESFAKLDRATSSWKIRQIWLFEGLDESLETWPRWGMMRNGE